LRRVAVRGARRDGDAVAPAPGARNPTFPPRRPPCGGGSPRHARTTSDLGNLMLSARSRDLIAESLPSVGPVITDITRHFYRSLFDEHPDLLRRMFNRGNQANGEQQNAIASALIGFASLLATGRTSGPRTSSGGSPTSTPRWGSRRSSTRWCTTI
jgi:hypothetical protein